MAAATAVVRTLVPINRQAFGAELFHTLGEMEGELAIDVAAQTARAERIRDPAEPGHRHPPQA